MASALPGSSDSMRILPALTAFVAIAALSCAAAQDDSGRTLIDPATGQPRYVPPLLQPWQDETVRLHPPRKHKKSMAEVAPTADTTTPPASVASTAEPAPIETPKRHKTKRVATAPTVQQTQPPQQIGNASDFTDLISPQTVTTPPKKVASAPAPKPVERAKPVETPPAEKPEQRASIEPPKPRRAAAHIAAGTRKDSIAFAPNASDPTTSAVSSVHSLAGSLSSALGNSTARVQLLAYAGMKGEKSSDTRRLSLKRALVIRQLLIDDGVPSERIDVFALGGADDDGPLDRVDIFVKS